MHNAVSGPLARRRLAKLHILGIMRNRMRKQRDYVHPSVTPPQCVHITRFVFQRRVVTVGWVRFGQSPPLRPVWLVSVGTSHLQGFSRRNVPAHCCGGRVHDGRSRWWRKPCGDDLRSGFRGRSRKVGGCGERRMGLSPRLFGYWFLCGRLFWALVHRIPMPRNQRPRYATRRLFKLLSSRSLSQPQPELRIAHFHIIAVISS